MYLPISFSEDLFYRRNRGYKTLRISPYPSNATVTLTAPPFAQVKNYIRVPKGTSVVYVVEAEGYYLSSDTVTVDTSQTLYISLTPVPEPVQWFAWTDIDNPDETVYTRLEIPTPGQDHVYSEPDVEGALVDIYTHPSEGTPSITVGTKVYSRDTSRDI